MRCARRSQGVYNNDLAIAARHLVRNARGPARIVSIVRQEEGILFWNEHIHAQCSRNTLPGHRARGLQHVRDVKELQIIIKFQLLLNRSRLQLYSMHNVVGRDSFDQGPPPSPTASRTRRAGSGDPHSKRAHFDDSIGTRHGRLTLQNSTNVFESIQKALCPFFPTKYAAVHKFQSLSLTDRELGPGTPGEGGGPLEVRIPDSDLALLLSNHLSYIK